jgi:hypothetical protein
MGKGKGKSEWVKDIIHVKGSIWWVGEKILEECKCEWYMYLRWMGYAIGVMVITESHN